MMRVWRQEVREGKISERRDKEGGRGDADLDRKVQ